MNPNDRATSNLPDTLDHFRQEGSVFSSKLKAIKQRIVVSDYGWYPYETLTALPLLFDLIASNFHEIRGAIYDAPVLDVGCGDGDLAMFFASLGCEVDAIDHAETNFNQLRGVKLLKRELALPVHIHDIDLDRLFSLPRSGYGLAVFLGTLYHLKNPFYVLETLANRADWCVLSTRIAQITPGERTRIENEPVAFLVGAREANDDPTNYWIFSFAGLKKLLERSGWIVVAERRVGCARDSDPVRPEADERAFVIAKSRIRHPHLYIRLLAGWHAPERDSIRWTAKQFSLEVTVPERVHEFALRFFLPNEAVTSGPIRVSCLISGEEAGSLTCAQPESLEFRGRFPFAADTYRLDFSVESGFQPRGDARDLGICVPLIAPLPAGINGIPFRIS